MKRDGKTLDESGPVATLRNLTDEEKRRRFRAGEYRFKAPPVCTVFWGEGDWIKWVDACEGWTAEGREDDEATV